MAVQITEEARPVILPIVQDHTQALKLAWLSQARGGIKGWKSFLAMLGYGEGLTVDADLTGNSDEWNWNPGAACNPQMIRRRREASF